MFKIALSKSQFFSILVLSFIAGLVVGVFIIIVFWPNFNWRLSLLVLFFIFSGLLRYQISLPDFENQKNIYYYNNQEISFTGSVENINRKITNQQIIIEAESINKTPVTGKVMVISALYQEYQY